MPFVPVSIISLFGLADFQLEAALLGAPAARREELQGIYGVYPRAWLLGKERFFPQNVPPGRGGDEL